MRIEKVETFIVESYLLVRITTEDGTQGIGESTYWAYPKATEETVKSMAVDLVGMDAGAIEHIWNWLYRQKGFRGPNLASAISAIDIALWDIKGKRLGAPVWDLLGGKVRQKVRAIALGVGGDTPDEIAASAKAVKEQGYTALKFTVTPGEWWLEKYPDFIRACEAQLAAVREAVGWDFDIGVEIHRNMVPSEAIVFCQRAEKYLPYFVEDPLAPNSVVAMAEVAEKINVPLAVGERNEGIWEFREYAELTKCAFFKPDVGAAGGISQMRKIAAVAESRHIRIVPHNFLTPVATAACVQLAACTPNWDLQEAFDETTGVRRAVVKAPIPVVDGYFVIPETPGIGVEFDEESAAKHPYKPMGHPTPLRDDGSVAMR